MKCTTCRAKDVELLTWWERTRNWLFLRTNHIFFPQDSDDLKAEHYTKGYADGSSDGIESERTTYARQKELYDPTPTISTEDQVEKRLVELLSPFDPRKVISLNKVGKIYIGNEPADDAQLANLKSEAEVIKSLDIWQLLGASIRALAEKAMFVDGENLDTMRKGRSMLFTLSSQQKIIDILSTYKGVDKQLLGKK